MIQIAMFTYLSNCWYRANPGTYWYYVIWCNRFLFFFLFSSMNEFSTWHSVLRLSTRRAVVQEETLSISLNVLIGMGIFWFSFYNLLRINVKKMQKKQRRKTWIFHGITVSVLFSIFFCCNRGINISIKFFPDSLVVV